MTRVVGADCLLALAMLVAPITTFADVIFTDNTFNLSNYSESTTFTSGASLTFEQCASCGNPGSALQIIWSVISPPPATSRIAIGFVNNAFSYNPQTQGTISSIGASIDQNFTWNFIVGNLGLSV
jgi:hypothetical protein